MAIGSLKTLIATLQAAATLNGVTVVYGEENVSAIDYAPPVVVVAPTGGPIECGAYWQTRDPEDDGIGAMITESVDLYLWAASTGTQSPIDDADAVETLRAQVLQALWGQQSQGLKVRTNASGRWIQMQDAVNRMGRGYVLTVQLDVSVPDVAPVEATVTSVTINQSI